ncbi:MFS transporter [Sinomonas sp. ASV486]|uniref:MDR family MFS transporter n=1 Tax=Sinomonas sp. ASV486 TaxID=3051170 RepID=UPI0027DE9A82|nr:MFS transporter [Sinomonas sp. ASV486]MDQ4491935.1 MFS transporter [Sinomonas sp. ASV486]
MSHKQILEALTGLLAAFFTAILSSTIVANALPTIMADLKGTQTDFAWVITAALLANAVTTPIWGKLADLFDKKLLTQLNIVVFVAGSVLAGFAQNIPWLISARVIQGVGLGGLTAMAMAIIGTMIPPRDRGKYNGYMGAVMAVGTAGGPLLGGFIVDSPLGWRWTFFVCVPLAVVALILIQITLKIQHVKRPAKIDWLGAVLLTASVSTLLVWVSFAGKADYYDWWSWQTAAMVGGSVVGLILLVIVESRVAMPIIPLKIVANRTTALSIVASAAVGVAMFASSSFLGQYFQVARGATPTEAGLLTLPMIAGNFIGSVASGQMITRTGRWKRFLVLGSILMIAGLGMLGTIDHTTELWLTGVYTSVLGLGLGMTMQNLVLGVQNTVRSSDIGTASSTVAFFRSVFGAVGVSVLGAVLSNRSGDLVVQGLADRGIKTAGGSAGGSMDLKDMPGPIADIVRGAFGDATARVFLIAAVIGVVALLAVLFIKEIPLRRTVDIVKPPTGTVPAVTSAAEVLAASAPAVAPAVADAANTPHGTVSAHDGGSSPVATTSPDAGSPQATGAPSPAMRRAAIREVLAGSEPQDAELDSELRLLLAESEPASGEHPARAEGQTLAAIQETQRLLGRQQAQLAQLMSRIADQLDAQQRLAAEQSQTAATLAEIQGELAAERALQKEAALYLATRGRHTAN